MKKQIRKVFKKVKVEYNQFVGEIKVGISYKKTPEMIAGNYRIGRQIEEKIKKSGITHTELSKAMKVSRQTMWSYRNGHSTIPIVFMEKLDRTVNNIRREKREKMMKSSDSKWN